MKWRNAKLCVQTPFLVKIFRYLWSRVVLLSEPIPHLSLNTGAGRSIDGGYVGPWIQSLVNADE